MSFPTLSVNLGFNITPTANFMVLDSPTRGKLDTATLAAGSGWTDITAYVLDVTTSRGRNRLLQAYKTGSCSLRLDNSDGRFDPNNLAGPYVAGGVTLLQPEVLVWINATPPGGSQQDVWYGSIDTIVPWYPPPTGRASWTTITASDGFKILNGFTPVLPSAPVGAGETTDARLTRLLAEAQWPSGQVNLDTGDSKLQATTLAQNVLAEAQNATDSEAGAMYMGADGNVTFERRNGIIGNTRSNTPQSTFDDQGVYLPFETFTPIYDDQLVRNSVREQAVGGVLQTANDGASQSQYYTQVQNNTSLMLQYDTVNGMPSGPTNPGNVADHAAWMLYLFKDPEFRIDSLTLDGVSDDGSGSLWTAICGRKLRDRIRVLLHPPISATIDLQLFVEGIDHQIGLAAGSARTWKSTFYTSSAVKYGTGATNGMFILNDATFGVLGQNELAGF